MWPDIKYFIDLYYSPAVQLCHQASSSYYDHFMLKSVEVWVILFILIIKIYDER